MEAYRFSGEKGDFELLSAEVFHLLYKMRPSLYLQMWPFPFCDPITRQGAGWTPSALPRHCEPSQKAPQCQPNQQEERKSISRATGRLLKLGLTWKEDNGLVISHVNIFKMPIASRQPFTLDICEEHQHWGKEGDRKLLPWTENIVTRIRERSGSFSKCQIVPF